MRAQNSNPTFTSKNIFKDLSALTLIFYSPFFYNIGIMIIFGDLVSIIWIIII